MDLKLAIRIGLEIWGIFAIIVFAGWAFAEIRNLFRKGHVSENNRSIQEKPVSVDDRNTGREKHSISGYAVYHDETDNPKPGDDDFSPDQGKPGGR